MTGVEGENEVRLEHVTPRRLAAAWGPAGPKRPFGPLIIELLNLVWPVLRVQKARTEQNVVVYFGGPPLRIAAGVEVPDGFSPTDTVAPLSTPSGEAVTVAHWGDYSEMHHAYARVERWCSDNGRTPAGVSWEVYGDWHADPSQLRTDVFILLQPASASRPR